MERNKTIAILAFLVILMSCNSTIQIEGLDKTKEVFDRVFVEKSIYSHFPTTIKRFNIIGGVFAPPDSTFQFGQMFLTLRTNENEIREIKSKNYIDIENVASDKLFFAEGGIFRDSFMVDTSKDYISLLPVANFEEFDFLLGEIQDSVYFHEEQCFLPYSRYVMPEDLMIYIIDAKPGYYWTYKNKKKRYSGLGKWQNGYSRGYAISEKYQLITYWLVAW